jgi:RNA polymerase sigma factor (sigma-70 family)
MIRKETACIVRQAVEKLLDRHRRAIVLFYFEGSGYDEIAAHLGLSVPGTKSLLARSRASLRRLLLEPSDAA